MFSKSNAACALLDLFCLRLFVRPSPVVLNLSCDVHDLNLNIVILSYSVIFCHILSYSVSQPQSSMFGECSHVPDRHVFVCIPLSHIDLAVFRWKPSLIVIVQDERGIVCLHLLWIELLLWPLKWI